MRMVECGVNLNVKGQENVSHEQAKKNVKVQEVAMQPSHGYHAWRFHQYRQFRTEKGLHEAAPTASHAMVQTPHSKRTRTPHSLPHDCQPVVERLRHADTSVLSRRFITVLDFTCYRSLF